MCKRSPLGSAGCSPRFCGEPTGGGDPLRRLRFPPHRMRPAWPRGSCSAENGDGSFPVRRAFSHRQSILRSNRGRPVVHRQLSQPSPPHPKQPRRRRSDNLERDPSSTPRGLEVRPREFRSRFDGHSPAIFTKTREERRRRESIDLGACSRVVLSKVAEHVGERVTRGSRRGQNVSVPSVGPETPSSKDEAIHAPRDSHCQPSHAGGKRAFVRSFDDQVQVIRLHREVHHSKNVMMASVRLGNRAFQRGKNELRAQRSKRRTERHVYRMSEGVLRTSAVRSRPPGTSFSSSPRPPTAPAIWKRQLLLATCSFGHVFMRYMIKAIIISGQLQATRVPKDTLKSTVPRD
jgi:hypothetical protein